MSNHWTDFPKETYTVEGQGIGALDIFDAVPGSWNIFTLVWKDELEALLSFKSEKGEFPIYTEVLPLAVGMALQRREGEEGFQTWGQLAEKVDPKTFLAKLKASPDTYKILILPELLGPGFWARAEAVAEAYISPAEERGKLLLFRAPVVNTIQ